MRTAYFTAALVVFFAGIANPSSIGLFNNLECTSCNLNIPVGSDSGTLYIMAASLSTPPWLCGVTGAEFRVQGLPAGWSVAAAPSPEAVLTLGDPFGAGANIAFAAVQEGECVLLYTVTLWPSAPGAEAVLEVVAHSNPSSPTRVCPVLVPADCPGGWPVCVGGGMAYVNSTTPCTVATTSITWTAAKALYE